MFFEVYNLYDFHQYSHKNLDIVIYVLKWIRGYLGVAEYYRMNIN